MTALPRNYDDWRLAGPTELDVVGTEDGDPCNRYPEPDEDAPSNYRPRPCGGLMVRKFGGDIICESCGSMA